MELLSEELKSLLEGHRKSMGRSKELVQCACGLEIEEVQHEQHLADEITSYVTAALDFPGLTYAEKAAVDRLTLAQMLSEWRFAPVGAFNQGGRSRYFSSEMFNRKEQNPAAWTAASKELS